MRLPMTAVRTTVALGAALAVIGGADGRVSIVAVGDILLDRGVRRHIERKGPHYPYKHVAPLLRQADVAFGNLECPITASGRPAPKPFSFRATPELAAGSSDAGFDVLSLANNHTLDCGRTGLTDTMTFLAKQGIHACGAGKTGAEAARATVIVRRGLRLAFLGFCDVVQDASFPRDDIPGISVASVGRIRQATAEARAMADLVVVSCHWGQEYSPRPSHRQRELARAAASAGADLVLGHHPHVVQGLEWLPGPGGRRALVAYSLGNFVFDTERTDASRTMILVATLNRQGVIGATVRPYVLQACAPVPARPADRQAIMQRIAELSRELGTRVERGHVMATQGRAAPRSRRSTAR